MRQKIASKQIIQRQKNDTDRIHYLYLEEIYLFFNMLGNKLYDILEKAT